MTEVNYEVIFTRSKTYETCLSSKGKKGFWANWTFVELSILIHQGQPGPTGDPGDLGQNGEPVSQ